MIGVARTVARESDAQQSAHAACGGALYSDLGRMEVKGSKLCCSNV